MFVKSSMGTTCSGLMPQASRVVFSEIIPCNMHLFICYITRNCNILHPIQQRIWYHLNHIRRTNKQNLSESKKKKGNEYVRRPICSQSNSKIICKEFKTFDRSIGTVVINQIGILFRIQKLQ